VDGFHKLIIMGISASVGLTMFLFGLGWDFMQGVADDVTVVREDVAFIKGILARWEEGDYTSFNIKP